jgi:hypothetical protein
MMRGMHALNAVPLDHVVTTYLRLGLPVFPCKPGSKKPATPHGFKSAIRLSRMTAEQQGAVLASGIDGFAEKGFNVGIATGDVVDVLDVDVKDGKPGLRAVRTLRDAGLLAGFVAIASTPSGGLHLYYPSSGQRSRQFSAFGLDVKAQGGYVVAPPSSVLEITDAGVVEIKKYEWLQECQPLDDGKPLDVERIMAYLGIQDAPRIERTWPTAAELGVPIAATVDGLARWLVKQDVDRNRALYWAANRAVEEGARTEEDLEPLVRASLTLSRPGETSRDHELRATIRSALRRAGVR